MFKIVRKEYLANNIYLMDILAPRVAKSAMPGQFIITRNTEFGERIPLTIADYDREKGTVTIVFQTVGKSTMELSKFNVEQNNLQGNGINLYSHCFSLLGIYHIPTRNPLHWNE